MGGVLIVLYCIALLQGAESVLCGWVEDLFVEEGPAGHAAAGDDGEEYSVFG